MALKRSLEKTIEIPEGVTVEVTPTLVSVKGEKGEVSRKIGSKKIIVSVEGKEVKIVPKIKNTRREKALINTLTSHVKNMIEGVQEPFVYKLKICSTHFPMKATLKGNVLEISNFMGEKDIRKVTLKEGVETKLEGDIITLTSPDKEKAGQVAVDIEQITKRPAFDRRIFMDGIYITEKAGVSLQ